MRQNAMPADFDLKAEWIWGVDKRPRQEAYWFFRREFALEEPPALGELWITVRTAFHLFVNGRHVSFGPPPHPQKGRAYLCRYDVTHLLQGGMNVIAVLAHNTQAGRFAARRQAGGLLAQFNADGKPLVWSNNSWQMTPGVCYAGNRPRRSVSAGFSEKFDAAMYPAGWTNTGFNTVNWRHPDVTEPVRSAAFELVPLDGSGFDSVWTPAKTICSRGSCHPVAPQTHVCFQGLVEKSGGGVYAAQTYIHSAAAMDVPFSLFSDLPYKFLCNGTVVKEQGMVSLPPGIDIDLAGFLCSKQGKSTSPDGVMHLSPGWNWLVVCQQVEEDSPGFTLMAPELPLYKWNLLREPDENAPPGWSLAGPLRAPLTNITGSLDLDGLIQDHYHPTLHPPVDEAVHLLAWQFAVASEDAQCVPEVLTLMEGQYAVIDWGQILYGVPAMRLAGESGACVDVLFGERLEHGRVIPCHEGRQNADAVVLGEAPLDWMGFAARGMRYAMLVVRSAKGSVKISNITCGHRLFTSEDVSSFECSDETVNRIWETGCRTLDVTMQDYFLDSPTKETAQYIPDAMIQSLTACLVHGNYGVAAKAIQDFADGQFETGEMSAVCPSDNYVNIPDYALLWPIWLHRFHMYSGYGELLQRMMPALERLMNYYAFVADDTTELLTDLDRRCSAPCFLDHGNLDRRGAVTGLNALYCRALWSAAWLAQEAGRTELSAIWRNGAARLSARLRETAFDPVKGLFADCVVDGRRSEVCSWQTSVLALYGGLARNDELETVFNRIFTQTPPFLHGPADAAENPYFKYFILETALTLGYRKWGLDLIRWYWGEMLHRGAVTWWEFFSPRLHQDGPPKSGSLCHGYGVSPNLFFLTELAGIRPATPGFKSIYFNPLLKGADWTKAEVSTPQGRIQVQWNNRSGKELSVTINSSYPVELIPILDPGVAETATFHVNENITVMAPVAG